MSHNLRSLPTLVTLRRPHLPPLTCDVIYGCPHIRIYSLYSPFHPEVVSIANFLTFIIVSPILHDYFLPVFIPILTGDGIFISNLETDTPIPPNSHWSFHTRVILLSSWRNIYSHPGDHHSFTSTLTSPFFTRIYSLNSPFHSEMVYLDPLW